MILNRWLIVAANGTDSQDSVRVVIREPKLARGECAFPLEVRIPESNRRILTEHPITITLPGWTPPEVVVGGAELIEDGDLESGGAS